MVEDGIGHFLGVGNQGFGFGGFIAFLCGI